MREIKFRAWDGKKFIYFGLTSLIFDAVEGDVHELYSLLRTGNFKPDRYTGLKDKNGVEIYEGSIVEETDNQGTWHAPVEYIGTEFLAMHPQGCNLLSDDCEVISNIYEQPELLKEVTK